MSNLYGLPAPPLVTYAEAEAIGTELHARWQAMTGTDAPLHVDDYAWADMVQFALRRASEIVRVKV